MSDSNDPAFTPIPDSESALPVPVADENVLPYPVGVDGVVVPEGDNPDFDEFAPVSDSDLAATPDRERPAEDAPDLRDIPIADLHEVANIRPSYDGVDDLVESMRVQGQLEPGMARPSPPGAKHDKPFELVFGYRRKRAAETLGWTHLRCEVRDLANNNVLDVMITENLQREDLSPVAEAKAMKAMVELGQMSQAAVARRLGVHPTQVSHRLKLLTLAPSVMAKIDDGSLSASHGETLTALPEAHQEAFAEKAASAQVSVRKLNSWVQKAKKELAEAPPEEPEALSALTPDHAIQIPHLSLRDGLTPVEEQHMLTYVLLRSCLDQEMLEYIDAEYGAPYEQLWDWVIELSPEDSAELTRRLVRRYMEAGHRYSSLEPSLVEQIGDPNRPFTATPGLEDGAITAQSLGGGDSWGFAGGLDALPPAFDMPGLPPVDESFGTGDDGYRVVLNGPGDPFAADDDGVALDDDAVEGHDDDLSSEHDEVEDDDAVAARDEDGADPNHDGDDDDVVTDRADDDAVAVDVADDVAVDDVVSVPEAPLSVEQGEVGPEVGDLLGRDAGEAVRTDLAVETSADVTETVEPDGPAKLVVGETGTTPPDETQVVGSDAEGTEPGLFDRIVEATEAIADALVSLVDLDEEKAERIAAQVAALDEIRDAGMEWADTGSFPDRPMLAGFTPALLAARLNDPTRALVALVALATKPEDAAPRLAALIDGNFDAAFVAEALQARQDIDPERASQIAARLNSFDDEVRLAAMRWARTGTHPQEPVIAGQSPHSLAEHLGKPSLVLSALCALRENPQLVLQRLGMSAPTS